MIVFQPLIFSGYVDFSDGSDRNHVSVVFTHATFLHVWKHGFPQIGREALFGHKKKIRLNWNPQTISKITSKQQHWLFQSLSFQWCFLNVGIYKKVIFPRYDYPQNRSYSTTIPWNSRLPSINLTTMVSLHQLWQQCSKKFSTLTTRNSHCTGEGKGQGWPPGLKWVQQSNHVNEMTRWYPLMTWFLRSTCFVNQFEACISCDLDFLPETQSWIWRKSSTWEIQSTS